MVVELLKVGIQFRDRKILHMRHTTCCCASCHATNPSPRVSPARFGKPSFHPSQLGPIRQTSVHPSQPGPIRQTIRPSESARPDLTNIRPSESARPDTAKPSVHPSQPGQIRQNHPSIRVSPNRFGKPSVYPSQSGTLRANPAHLHARDMTTLLSHSLVLSLSHSLSHTPLSLSLSLLSHSLTLFSLFLLNPKPLHSLSTTSFPLSYSVPFFVPLPFFCPLILSIEPTQDET